MANEMQIFDNEQLDALYEYLGVISDAYNYMRWLANTLVANMPDSNNDVVDLFNHLFRIYERLDFNLSVLPKKSERFPDNIPASSRKAIMDMAFDCLKSLKASPDKLRSEGYITLKLDDNVSREDLLKSLRYGYISDVYLGTNIKPIQIDSFYSIISKIRNATPPESNFEGVLPSIFNGYILNEIEETITLTIQFIEEEILKQSILDVEDSTTQDELITIKKAPVIEPSIPGSHISQKFNPEIVDNIPETVATGTYVKHFTPEAFAEDGHDNIPETGSDVADEFKDFTPAGETDEYTDDAIDDSSIYAARVATGDAFIFNDDYIPDYPKDSSHAAETDSSHAAVATSAKTGSSENSARMKRGPVSEDGEPKKGGMIEWLRNLGKGKPILKVETEGPETETGEATDNTESDYAKETEKILKIFRERRGSARRNPPYYPAPPKNNVTEGAERNVSIGSGESDDEKYDNETNAVLDIINKKSRKKRGNTGNESNAGETASPENNTPPHGNASDRTAEIEQERNKEELKQKIRNIRISLLSGNVPKTLEEWESLLSEIPDDVLGALGYDDPNMNM